MTSHAMINISTLHACKEPDCFFSLINLNFLLMFLTAFQIHAGNIDGNIDNVKKIIKK